MTNEFIAFLKGTLTGSTITLLIVLFWETIGRPPETKPSAGD